MSSTTLVDGEVVSRGRLLPLLILFFVGGACGLISAVLWLRQWSLIFGLTAPALAAALGAFLCGLVVGGIGGGRYADRSDRPLAGYALIALLLAVLALASPFALKPVGRFSFDLLKLVPDSTVALNLARFGLSFGFLVVPAALLGASLPVLAVASGVRPDWLGERFSLLVATGTAGAAAGVFGAGFLLVGRYGVAASFRFAAAGHVAVGIAAWGLSWAWERARPSVPWVRPRGSGSHPDPTPEHVRPLVLLVISVTGLAAPALAVVWFRMLELYAERTSYAFAIMLATGLGGIAVGSCVAAVLTRWLRNSLVPLTIAVLAVAPAALSSTYLLTKTYTFADRFGSLVPSDDPSAPRFVFVTSALTVLPTTLLVGLVFCIGLRAWTGGARPSEMGQRVGVFYACSVAGGVVSVPLVGMGLVPLLGARRSVVAIAVLALISGVALALLAGGGRARYAIAGGAVAIFLLGTQVSVRDPYRVALGHRYPGERIRWLDEDALTTVDISERRDGTRVMYVNGLQQATNNPFKASALKFTGALPWALHPNPRRALVIGLGGGVVAGTLSAHPGVTVDVLEPSRAVARGARYLSDVNGLAQRNNVRVRVDDGRTFLRVSENLYDVIAAEEFPPDQAGGSRLWSIEYWEAARDALADGGIMLQSLPYDRSQAEYDMVMRSFLQVFPNATLWAEGTTLIGTREPLFIDRRAITLKLAAPDIRLFLAEAGITGLDAITARYTAGPDQMRRVVRNGPVLTDDRPRMEYFRSLDVGPGPADTTRIRGSVGDILRG
jgi:spermidine synthase